MDAAEDREQDLHDKRMERLARERDELMRLRKIEEALKSLLPEPLPWREEGEGIIAISVHKRDLRAARASLSSQNQTEGGR